MALADYGADVIKIEAPGEGDPHRHNYKRAATYPRSENNFPLQLDGRLKRSLALDLKKPEARPVLERLVRRADIMIVNFPPPARERLSCAGRTSSRSIRAWSTARSPATARPAPTATGRAST